MNENEQTNFLEQKIVFPARPIENHGAIQSIRKKGRDKRNKDKREKQEEKKRKKREEGEKKKKEKRKRKRRKKRRETYSSPLLKKWVQCAW